MILINFTMKIKNKIMPWQSTLYAGIRNLLNADTIYGKLTVVSLNRSEKDGKTSQNGDTFHPSFLKMDVMNDETHQPLKRI